MGQVNAADGDGWTALHAAAASGREQVQRELVRCNNFSPGARF